jgi:hypothetical protein
LQSSIPESCKLKFPIIATQHVKSYLAPQQLLLLAFLAPAIKSLSHKFMKSFASHKQKTPAKISQFQQEQSHNAFDIYNLLTLLFLTSFIY